MTTEQKQSIRDRIGQRIATLRKEKGWSQDELSQRAGLQFSHVCRIEEGRYAVTIEVLQAIAEALGMTVDFTYPK